MKVFNTSMGGVLWASRKLIDSTHHPDFGWGNCLSLTVNEWYWQVLSDLFGSNRHKKNTLFPIPPLPKFKLDWLSEWTESQSCLSHKMAVSHSNITPESGSTYVLFNMTSSYLTIIYQRNNLPNFQTWSANVVGEIGCRYRLLLKFA